MTAQRLSKVQLDVLDRLEDGWEFRSSGVIAKDGEAPRHVSYQTFWSLVERGFIRFERPSGQGGRWVLV